MTVPGANWRRQRATAVPDRWRYVQELRDDHGASFEHIASLLGVTRQRAHDIYRRAKERDAAAAEAERRRAQEPVAQPQPPPPKPTLKHPTSQPESVLDVVTQLILDTADGPQRDYYVGVRMRILRDRRHGYVICRACGEPHLSFPGNHTRRLYGSARTNKPQA